MAGSKSFMLYEGEDFDIRLEYTQEYAILHLPRVSKFTKGTLQHGKAKLEEYWEFFSTLGYKAIFAGVAPEDTKMRRLLGHLGFQYMTDNDGLSVYIFVGD